VDEASSQERQIYVFNFIYNILESVFSFSDKEEALHYFQRLRQLFNGWNSSAWQSEEFKNSEREISLLLNEKIKKEKVNV